jgi:hypothetical protein
MSLEADARWRMLREGVAPCSCGRSHKGVEDLEIYWPDPWPHGAKIEDNRALTADRLDGDFLSSDYCIMEGKYYAIRVSLELPLQNSNSKLALIVWSALPKNEFVSYFNAANQGRAPGEGRAAGHLLNNIPGYEKTYGLHTVAEAPGRFLRPKLFTIDESHPLTQDQRQGITLDRTLEMYALFGHTMRFGASLN